VESESGVEEVCPPILQLSAEKINRYGVYLMDYGVVSLYRGTSISLHHTQLASTNIQVLCMDGRSTIFDSFPF
jgi:hypothetical protein